MDNKAKSQNKICPAFQEKIFKLLEYGKTVDSDSSLKNHIKICPDCKDYLEKLSILKNHMQGAPPYELIPNPQILKNNEHLRPVF